jgi:hypothetical protein
VRGKSARANFNVLVLYRAASISAAAIYGMVVYKASRTRSRAGSRAPGSVLALAVDENVQYLGQFFCAPPTASAVVV